MSRSVFIIGAGSVGTSLGRALVDAGIAIHGVFCREPAHADRAGRRVDAPAHSGGLPSAIKDSEVVLVTVPDPAIGTVARRAVDTRITTGAQVWLHCAGGLSAAALAPLGGHVRGIGTLHPALAFPKDRVTPVPRGASFAIEGDPPALEAARELVAALGGVAVEIPAEGRAVYHAALVLASNYLVAQLAQAREVLAQVGLTDPAAEQLLVSLAESALAGASSVGIDSSLTGPIRRGDVAAVERHLAALRDMPQATRLYRELGRATLRMVRERRGLTADGLAALAELLGSSDDDGAKTGSP